VGGCAGERRWVVAGGEKQSAAGRRSEQEERLGAFCFVFSVASTPAVRIYFVGLGLELQISFPMYSNQYFISRVFSPQVKDHLYPN
jgi:hypothetical protein